jgi:hypothetical protein
MKAGFAKTDITPRVGVELAGFGPFINRHSIGVRDRLWARAMALDQDGKAVVLISCDLISVTRAITARVRRLVSAATPLPPEAVMINANHTHSGPDVAELHGWGGMDAPYREILPQRIADAAIRAVGAVQETAVFHAEVPCEGIGLNREYEQRSSPLDAVLQESWRPAKPELTDTTCHVVRFESGGKISGFFSYFGCHPVVCCQATHYIHGDFCGVATNLLEREHPGSVGLFLQGAQGDVNTCVVHQPEQESLLALDVIASRYARAVRRGLAEARPVHVDSLSCILREVAFARKPLDLAKLRALLAEQEAILQAPGASDTDEKVCMATVHALSLRQWIAAAKAGAGKVTAPSTEIQGFRVGPMLLLASPFETFQAIKNDIKARTGVPLTLVLGCTNDTLGYAPDRTAAARGGYAADVVPLIVGTLPFSCIHDELVEQLVALAAALQETSP